ncbi:MAG: hypothetical protein BGO31_02135 [Bacteroidetes bacterium 43-16]|nr:MAG: hypothetical protein BGO31_02135 [Bacteroidetes bacterium 43-16]
MKNIIATLFLLHAVVIGYGQSLSFSKTQKFNPKKELFSIGGWVQDHLMIYYTEKNKSFLDLYDANMERKAIVSLNFMPSAPKQVQLLPQAQQSLLIYSAQINNKEFFYVSRLDKDGKILGRPKSVDTASQNFFGNTKFSYQFIHSEANDKVGVFSYRIKDSKLDFRITVVDDSLNVVHSSAHTVPIKSFYEVAQVILKDDGRFVILVTDLSTNKNDEVAEAMVYVVQPEDKRNAAIKAFPFDFGDVFVANIFLKEDINNTNIIHFAGLTKGKMGTLDGVYSGKIDMTALNNEPVAGKNIMFDNNINGAALNQRGIIRNFVIQDIVVKNDGGMVLVSEAFAKIVRTNYAGPGYYNVGYGSMGTTRYIEYYYGNILILDLNADQRLKAYSTIPKWQKSVDDYGIYASYSLLNTGSNMAFVYNDLLNKGYKVNSTIVNLDGKQETAEITAQMKGDGKWIPKMGTQTSAKELVIPVLGGNKLQFVKVNF